MSITQRLSREPNVILGVLVAGLSLLVLFGVNLSGEQMAGIGIFVGTLIALVRFITTPSSEVAAQVDPATGDAKAGAAAQVKTGTPVNVVTPDNRYVA
jgi:hypothetical protein